LHSAYDEYDDISEGTNMSVDIDDDDNVVITQNIEVFPKNRKMDSPITISPRTMETHMLGNQGASPEHRMTDSPMLTTET